MGWLDLHMHSNISNDGEYTPKELMGLCHGAGLKVVALTDHNSVRGVEEAMFYAKQFHIQCIPAIELDCTFKGVDLHVLGYGIDTHCEEFGKIELDILKQEQNTSMKRMELIKELGIKFDYDKLMTMAIDNVITGEMIAEVAIKDERNKDNSVMAPFYPGGDRSDNPYVNFYWDLCSLGKAAYVPMNFISLYEAIKLIGDRGGIPVLAHPGINVKENEELLDEIREEGIKGIEVYSSYHSLKQTDFYKNKADAFPLIKTIGSDFHGKIKPSVKLGGVPCSDSEDEIYQQFMNNLLR